MRLSEGLIVAHLFLLLTLALGSIVFPWCERDPEKCSPSHSMLRAVCTSGIGFALLGFCAFFLALFGIFNLWSMALALVFLGLSAPLFKSSPIWKRTFWVARLAALCACWDGPLLAVYLGMVVLAMPAANQANIGTDSMSFHLVYAIDWANAGRLIVDPFVRTPFYASNFVLLYSICILLGASVFCMFLVWAMGALAALAVCAGARWVLEGAVDGRWASATGILAAASFTLAASYFRWLDTAYLDVALGAFALMAVCSMLLALRERDGRWLYAAAISSAFLIGMKGSFLPFVAVFGIALFVSTRTLKLEPRRIAILAALFLALSLPWYVRNTILAGEPTPPVINLAVYKHDGFLTSEEAQTLLADLKTARSPVDLIDLPVRAFLYADTVNFREYGTNGIVAFCYFPVLVVFGYFVFGTKRLDGEVLVPTFVVTMLVAYWAMSSSLLRYAVLFVPLLALCCVVVMVPILRKIRWGGAAMAFLAVLMVIPTGGSAAYFRDVYRSEYKYLPTSYLDDDSYQRRFLGGYREAALAVRLIDELGIGRRVYDLAVANPQIAHLAVDIDLTRAIRRHPHGDLRLDEIRRQRGGELLLNLIGAQSGDPGPADGR